MIGTFGDTYEGWRAAISDLLVGRNNRICKRIIIAAVDTWNDACRRSACCVRAAYVQNQHLSQLLRRPKKYKKDKHQKNGPLARCPITLGKTGGT
jgi:hypothetical protein